MFQEWQVQSKNWRCSQDSEEDKPLERYLVEVLSPRNNSKEGQESLRRKKLFQKEGKLEASWSLMREYKDYVEKNDERWKIRTREETARLREKLERLEMVKRKQVKYKKTYLTKEETTKLKERAQNIL
jgi:hypothetical protein